MPTPTIDDAVDALRKLPQERQQELAGYILQLATDDGSPEDIAPDHLPSVLEGLEQAKHGQFASPERVAAAFRRFEK
jgi:hypothetical protein